MGLAPHANVVRLLGVAWSIDAGRVCSVFELCEGGTLADALGTLSRGWTTAHKWQVASGIASGVAFLHAQAPAVMHRDLKPENILFADSIRLVPKIADFGTSRKIMGEHAAAATAPSTAQRSGAVQRGLGGGSGLGKEAMTSDCSTPLFSSPEMLAQQHYDLDVDVWALGCCLCCLYLDAASPYYPDAASSGQHEHGIERSIRRMELDALAQCAGVPLPKDSSWLDMMIEVTHPIPRLPSLLPLPVVLPIIPSTRSYLAPPPLPSPPSSPSTGEQRDPCARRHLV